MHVAVQLLVELRCEQVGGQGSTSPARQSASVTSTMPWMQPDEPKQTEFRQLTHFSQAAMQQEPWSTMHGRQEKNLLGLNTINRSGCLTHQKSPVCVPMSLVQGWLLQLWLCMVMPSQSSPPFLGGGAEQVLFRCRTPPPHFASHSDHCVHSDQ